MLSGTGFFVWKVRWCEDGTVTAIADQAERAGLSHVLIKACDGAGMYNIAPLGFEALAEPFRRLLGIRTAYSGVDLLPPLVAALRERGIAPWLWQYVYGSNPLGEVAAITRTIRALTENGIPPAGLVVNAEVEFKQPGRGYAARAYMGELRAEYPDLLVGLSTYRWPSYHPEFPYEAFMDYCDFTMPQVYHMQAHNPAAQLRRSLQEWKARFPDKPFFPTLAAFHEHGWQPTVGEITEAMQEVAALGLSGCNFWEWGNCKKYLPDGWEVIRSTAWADTPGQPDPPVTPEQPSRPVLQMRALVDGQRIRRAPTLSAEIVGYTSAGQVYQVSEVAGADAWGRIGPNEWAAIETGGKRYLEEVA